MPRGVAFVAVLVLSACRSTSDYTPQIPIAPGAVARMLWIESLGLSSAPSVLPKPDAGAVAASADGAVEQDEHDEPDGSARNNPSILQADAGAVGDAGAVSGESRRD